MNWSNVRWILAREIRDQFRDRRTLFMITVLPILLYPLLGASIFQIAQFRRERPMTVLIVGRDEVQNLQPPLVAGDRFAAELFGDPARARLLDVQFDEPANNSTDRLAEARRQVRSGRYDAVLYFPAGFARQLDQFRRALAERKFDPSSRITVPQPEIVFSKANEKSLVAYERLSGALQRWNELVVRKNLADSGLPDIVAQPIDIKPANVADPSESNAAVWSKVLPVLLLLWALTGAFYPAIDLCAGEKERGTLETLLSSPAQRTEIVLGKLLTIILFSMITAALNVVSMGITGAMVGQVAGLGAPPLLAAVWLAVALLPVSALFSALSLALAAFARSTKEGQYYLMPLMLVIMPLAVLSNAPGMELTLGNSLIPVTNVVLLLRAMIEGHYLTAARFALPVIATTFICCLLAVRWAVDQFNSESVLFRESERLDLGLWLRHMWRERRETPAVAAAVFCGLLILAARFVFSFSLPNPADFQGLLITSLITQVVVVLVPALLMTALFARSPRQTLMLRIPAFSSVVAAALLAVAIIPLRNLLSIAIHQLYPLNDEIARMFEGLLRQSPNFGLTLAVVALAPALCEELAFRGFIFTGLMSSGRKWRAIVVSALFFGVTHLILQQSIVAAAQGIVLGIIAAHTASILPCMVYHFVNNGLALYLTRPEVADRYPWLVSSGPTDVAFWIQVAVSTLATAGLLAWLIRSSGSRNGPDGDRTAAALPPFDRTAVAPTRLEQAQT